MNPRTPWQKVLAAGAAGIAAFSVGALMRGHSGFGAADEVVAPSARVLTPARAATSNAEPASLFSHSRLESDVAFNPFGALNMGAPARLGQPKEAAPPLRKRVKQAPPAPPLPAPAPVAPPLPFVAIGSIVGAEVTNGQPVAFLQQQDQLLVVHAGESIGTSYRVESITPQRIEFTYLPLKQRQSLPLAP